MAAYSSVSPLNILSLTYVQFNLLLEEISSKLAWQVKLAGFPYTQLAKEDFPIYEKAVETSVEETKKLSWREAMRIKAIVDKE